MRSKFLASWEGGPGDGPPSCSGGRRRGVVGGADLLLWMTRGPGASSLEGFGLVNRGRDG